MAANIDEIKRKFEILQRQQNTSHYISQKQREEWEEKNRLLFESFNWETDILPIIKECYQIAIADTEFNIPYSDLVLKNIQLITSREVMEISYKQWKSFKAYHNSNCKKQIQQSNLHKLGL